MNPTDLINQAINTLELALAQLQNYGGPVEQPPPPPPAPPASNLNPVTAAWLGGGGPTPGPQEPPPAEAQPEFRDGNVHTFPGTWDLTADHDCKVAFSGGEVPGRPGPAHLTLTIDGFVVVDEQLSTNTLFDIPEHRAERGSRIVLTITGAPMMARLAVR